MRPYLDKQENTTGWIGKMLDESSDLVLDLVQHEFGTTDPAAARQEELGDPTLEADHHLGG
jgi:hypothetical protein